MERIRLNLFLSIITYLCISGCSKAQTQESEYLVLEPESFAERLSKEESPQLIDVRTSTEFESGTIDKSINYNILDGTFNASISKLDKEKTVFVFCAKGGRSNKAAAVLKKKGFSSVIDLKGGFESWNRYQSKLK